MLAFGMPAAFTREDVAKIAALANLELEPAEIDLFARQLGDILSYAEAGATGRHRRRAPDRQRASPATPPTVRTRCVRRSIATRRSPTRPTRRSTPASSRCRESSDDRRRDDHPRGPRRRCASRRAVRGRGVPRRAGAHRGARPAAARLQHRGRRSRARPRRRHRSRTGTVARRAAGRRAGRAEGQPQHARASARPPRRGSSRRMCRRTTPRSSPASRRPAR